MSETKQSSKPAPQAADLHCWSPVAIECHHLITHTLGQYFLIWGTMQRWSSPLWGKNCMLKKNMVVSPLFEGPPRTAAEGKSGDPASDRADSVCHTAPLGGVCPPKPSQVPAKSPDAGPDAAPGGAARAPQRAWQDTPKAQFFAAFVAFGGRRRRKTASPRDERAKELRPRQKKSLELPRGMGFGVRADPSLSI